MHCAKLRPRVPGTKVDGWPPKICGMSCRLTNNEVLTGSNWHVGVCVYCVDCFAAGYSTNTHPNCKTRRCINWVRNGSFFNRASSTGFSDKNFSTAAAADVILGPRDETTTWWLVSQSGQPWWLSIANLEDAPRLDNQPATAWSFFLWPVLAYLF